MRGARQVLEAETLSWLLKPDRDRPGVRLMTLRDLLGRPIADPDVRRAQAAVMRSGPVPAILKAQHPDGYWLKPGGGYGPKYISTIWQIQWLAELGADPNDERVRKGCEYILDHSRAGNGGFAFFERPTPSGAVHCLNGNLAWALQKLSFADDPRLREVLEWIARAITGEGNFRFYASGTNAPGFACAINEGQPCGWGANKSIRALLAIPPRKRSPLIQRALARGAAFLLSRDPALADYPYTQRVSSTWFKLGFPLTYWSDVLETVDNLARLGYAEDPRLARAWSWVLGKQDGDGRWPLENPIRASMWAEIESQRGPNKWVTLRALRALKASGRLAIPRA
jgi:hypothetical protein